MLADGDVADLNLLNNFPVVRYDYLLAIVEWDEQISLGECSEGPNVVTSDEKRPCLTLYNLQLVPLHFHTVVRNQCILA